MPTFEESVQINAAAAEVFAYATDLSKMGEWNPDILRVQKLDAGPIKAGSIFRETRRVGKREATAAIRVTAHDPPTTHAAESKALWVTLTYTYHFAALDDGMTRVDLHARAKGWGPGLLFAGWMLRMARKVDGEQLSRLKAAIEHDKA
ncbi:MAG: SRPBCC family protein [Acidobacteriota bacterium]